MQISTELTSLSSGGPLRSTGPGSLAAWSSAALSSGCGWGCGGALPGKPSSEAGGWGPRGSPTPGPCGICCAWICCWDTTALYYRLRQTTKSSPPPLPITVQLRSLTLLQTITIHSTYDSYPQTLLSSPSHRILTPRTFHLFHGFLTITTINPGPVNVCKSFTGG